MNDWSQFLQFLKTSSLYTILYKTQARVGGSSAFVDAVRLVYRVEHIKNDAGEISEGKNRLIILDKDNNGAKKYLGSTRVKRQIFPKKKSVIEIEYE